MDAASKTIEENSSEKPMIPAGEAIPASSNDGSPNVSPTKDSPDRVVRSPVKKRNKTKWIPVDVPIHRPPLPNPYGFVPRGCLMPADQQSAFGRRFDEFRPAASTPPPAFQVAAVDKPQGCTQTAIKSATDEAKCDRSSTQATVATEELRKPSDPTALVAPPQPTRPPVPPPSQEKNANKPQVAAPNRNRAVSAPHATAGIVPIGSSNARKKGKGGNNNWNNNRNRNQSANSNNFRNGDGMYGSGANGGNYGQAPSGYYDDAYYCDGYEYHHGEYYFYGDEFHGMPVNADGTVTFYDPATNSYYYATAGDYQQIAGAEETAAAGATFGADGMNGYYQAAGGSTALDGAGGVDSFGGIKTWTRPRHRRQSDKANGAFLRGLGGPNLGRTSSHTLQ